MNRNKNNPKELDAEFGSDSRYASEKECNTEATALMESRLMRMKNLSKEQITRAKLLPLKEISEKLNLGLKIEVV